MLPPDPNGQGQKETDRYDAGLSRKPITALLSPDEPTRHDQGKPGGGCEQGRRLS